MATTPTLSSPGIGSGLDVNGIVQKLMTVEQQPLTQLAKQEAADQAKITAYGTLKSSLSALQAALDALSTTERFKTLSATSSDASSVAVSISGKPVTGAYSIAVSQLAQAQKLVSSGFATTSDLVGTGTLTFELGTFAGGVFTTGTGGAKVVTIPAGQNSLAGIRDAVNAANIGVTATIVNDGTATGNRLVFTSAQSGAANSMRITVADADGNSTDTSGLSQLAYDPSAAAGAGRNLTQKVAAQDALLTIDGIDVRSASNTVKDAIDGLTLTLTKPTAAPASLSVATSTTDVDAKVAAFVKAYNDLNATFTSLTRYDATKKQASVLTGDSAVRTIQNQLRSLLGGRLSSGTISTLSEVGVAFQADGTLKLDSTKLDAALNATPDAVTRLFAAMASASDTQVSVTSYSASTRPGTYALALGQLATRGNVTGSAASALAFPPGDTLDVAVDGIAATIGLNDTYANAAALAADLQAKINGMPALTQSGGAVTVAESNGIITITSNRYGSHSTATAAGSAAAAVFGAPTAMAGVDATGTLDGMGLTGNGQTLSGVKGSAVEGISLTVANGSIGPRGSVTFSTGFAYQLSALIKKVVDSDGPINARTEGLNREIKDIGKRRDALNTHLALVEANYRAQFNALDSLLSNLQAQSTALAQQLANLPKITSTSSTR